MPNQSVTVDEYEWKWAVFCRCSMWTYKSNFRFLTSCETNRKQNIGTPVFFCIIIIIVNELVMGTVVDGDIFTLRWVLNKKRFFSFVHENLWKLFRRECNKWKFMRLGCKWLSWKFSLSHANSEEVRKFRGWYWCSFRGELEMTESRVMCRNRR